MSKSISTQEYMAKHDITQILQNAVNSCLAENSADPLQFFADYFQSAVAQRNAAMELNDSEATVLLDEVEKVMEEEEVVAALDSNAQITHDLFKICHQFNPGAYESPDVIAVKDFIRLMRLTGVVDAGLSYKNMCKVLQGKENILSQFLEADGNEENKKPEDIIGQDKEIVYKQFVTYLFKTAVIIVGNTEEEKRSSVQRFEHLLTEIILPGAKKNLPRRK